MQGSWLGRWRASAIAGTLAAVCGGAVSGSGVSGGALAAGIATPPEDIQVGVEDNGASYHLPLGSTVFVGLPAGPRPTGKWSWQRRLTDPGVLSRIGPREVVHRPADIQDDDEINTFDRFHLFGFVADGPGTALVEFRFKSRPRAGQDDDVPENDRFRIKVEVAAP